jgi:hypothetical protein
LGAYSRSDASIAPARADGVDAQIRTDITDDTTPIENGSRGDIFMIAPMARLREGIRLNAGCDGDGPLQSSRKLVGCQATITDAGNHGDAHCISSGKSSAPGVGA